MKIGQSLLYLLCVDYSLCHSCCERMLLNVSHCLQLFELWDEVIGVIQWEMYEDGLDWLGRWMLYDWVRVTRGWADYTSLALWAALLPVTAWNPVRMFATVHLDWHDSHWRNCSLSDFCSLVSLLLHV